MEVGIIGLPLAGKTTIFNALTRSNAETARYSSGRCEVRTAVVDVPDPRVNTLSEMFHPRKTTFAKIQFNDISGIAKGSSQGTGLDPQVLNALSKCDAILMVVRTFEDDDVPAALGEVAPARELSALRMELILSDLGIVERRVERIPAGIKKARPEEKPALQKELELMERFQAMLEGGELISSLALSEEERHLIRGFQFLTAKPEMVIVNLGEESDAAMDLSWAQGQPATAALALKGTIEMEIAQLPDDERNVFLLEYGITEPGLYAMVRTCYDLLGLMSFFTVGEDEVRAWTVRRDAAAVEAAGTIHTDLARGFIRAEVLAYDDMMACGTMVEARKQGKLRLEGKEYVVQNGDILNIRFNI
jgi:hypothetical protein